MLAPAPSFLAEYDTRFSFRPLRIAQNHLNVDSAESPFKDRTLGYGNPVADEF
jgi:hypothetical protein